MEDDIYDFQEEENEEDIKRRDILRDVIRDFVDRGEMRYDEKKILGFSTENMEKIILRHNQRKQEALNVSITKVLVQKFSGLMCSIGMSTGKLENTWLEDELFMNDLKNVVSHITPHVPFIGLLSGAASFGRDFVEKRCTQPKV